jgi:diguanylate cyclase (GGDEF)-like protein
MPELIRDPFALHFFSAAQEGIAIFADDGSLVAWNAAARAITGWDQAAAASRDLLARDSGMLEIRDGKWVDMRRSTMTVDSRELRVLIFADATAQYALTRARHQLTDGGLIDRASQLVGPEIAAGHIERSISLARRDARAVGVLSIGVDIPRVAEDVPYAELMGQLGKRVLAATRGSDLAARLSERELAIVLTAMANANDVAIVSVRTLLQLSQPYVLGGRERSVTVSLGGASFPTDGETAADILGAAHMAMTSVREQGGGYRLAVH